MPFCKTRIFILRARTRATSLNRAMLPRTRGKTNEPSRKYRNRKRKNIAAKRARSRDDVENFPEARGERSGKKCVVKQKIVDYPFYQSYICSLKGGDSAMAKKAAKKSTAKKATTKKTTKKKK
jgi:hypothetical protein